MNATERDNSNNLPEKGKVGFWLNTAKMWKQFPNQNFLWSLLLDEYI